MNPVRLALRVLRVDPRTRMSTVLTAVGVAVATALILLLSSLPHASQVRHERSQWQYGSDGSSQTTPGGASKAVATQNFVQGDQIVRLDVSGHPAMPRGAPRLPGPGQVLLSPRLAELAHQLPRDQLADRFPGTVVGVLDVHKLAYPEQLVAVVGHQPGALVEMPSSGTVGGSQTEHHFFLVLLAWVGIALLSIPSLVLVSSAARLTAARRERRLAALRLAGGTPRQVVATVATETAVAAVGGTLGGLVAGWPLRFLVRAVPWDGGTWLVSDLTPSPSMVVSAGVGIPLLVVLAAVLGLWRVVRTPVGAALHHPRRRPSAWRLLALVAVAAFFAYGLSVASSTGGVAMLIGSLAAIGLSTSVVGPWVTATLGALFIKVWRRPATLLAGRRLRSDPKSAYRATSGVVLAVFVGSMALTLLPGLGSVSGSSRSFKDSALFVDVPTARAPEVKDRIVDQLGHSGRHPTVAEAEKVVLADPAGRSYPGLVMSCDQAASATRMAVGSCAGPPSVRAALPLPSSGLRVASEIGPSSGGGQRGGLVLPSGVAVRRLGPQASDLAGSLLIDSALVPRSVSDSTTLVITPANAVEREQGRTALTLAMPGIEVNSREQTLHNQQSMLTDLRRVTTIGLTIAAVLAGCSAAITATASVVDRRRTFGALIAAGTPLRVLVRALRTEAVLPALVTTLGAGAGGVTVGIGMLTLFDINGGFSMWVFAPVGLGVLVAILAASASGPMLRKVSTEPVADE